MVSNPTLPTENINQVILGLLKIKSGTELDYQTYFNVIKKRLAAHRMVGAKIPAEEDQLLREELKRVGKLKDKGRFKIKEKTARVSNVPPSKGPGPVTSDRRSRPPKSSAIIKAPFDGITKDFIQSPVEPVSVKDVAEKTTKVNRDSPLYRINKTLDSILTTLVNTGKEEAKEKERQRKEAENKKRAEREKGLESKSFEGIKKALSAIIKPFQSIWDRIFNFIFYTLLGRAVMKLLDWFGDPKNKEKIQSIIRFLVDFGPALLGGYILFGTKFGKALRFLGGIVIKGIVNLTRFAIPKLLTFIRGNPLAAGLALFTAGATIPAIFPGTVDEQERKTKAAPGTKEEKIKALQEQKSKLNFFEKLQGKGSEIDEQISFLQTGKTKAYGFSGGGFSGSGLKNRLSNLRKGPTLFEGAVSGPKGRDKVPAMLTDGEFVMSVGAVNKYGVDTLEAMNAAGGGTNQPTITNGVTHAFGGGPVGNIGDGRGTKSDPLYQIDKFLDNYFGKDIDIKNPYTWPPKGSGVDPELLSGFGGKTSKSENVFVRGANEIIKKLVNVGGGPSGTGGRPSGGGGFKLPGLPSGGGPSGTGGRIGEVITAAAEKAKPAIQSLPGTIDYGSLYLRSQFGGLGGSITEADLSKQTQSEYQKAFARAKANLPNRIQGAESAVRSLEIQLRGPNLTLEQKKIINNQLANARGELSKYKKGLVNVEYDDFKDEKGKLSPSAEAAQKTLGAVWASSTKDGGIKIEKEPYDFPLVEDPLGLMMWKQLNDKEKRAWLDKQPKNSAVRKKLDPNLGGGFGKWGKQDIAEAMYTLNPFATPVETDVKIGGKPRAKGIFDTLTNALDNPLLSMGRGLGMNILKGKERNTITGESEEGSFMDKFFPSAKKREQREKEEFIKKNPGAKLYAKPQQNKSYRNQKALEEKRPWWDKMGWFGGGSRVAQEQTKAKPKIATAKPKPKSSTPPVKPKSKPNVTVVKSSQYRGGQRGSGANPSQRAPSPSPRHRAGTATAERTTGTRRK